MNDFVQRNMYVLEGMLNYNLGSYVSMGLTKDIISPGQWINAKDNQLMAYVCKKSEYWQNIKSMVIKTRKYIIGL